ncbi:MAG: pirin family protein [Alphaproteobacteria bacterium]|nr:pirin family protein [Alphaproteobacteria bacterium]NCQ87728.1 pirin family protein [Alphaproteobacteria bacterium]NCT05763.1 pirin family protein [Alphaproteobacteria bacterium]
MIKIHDRDLRGKTQIGWLDSAHAFSFGHFQDPARMGFKSLRVFNDDRVIGGAGFSPHSHANMEIISYVLDGALAHKDSTGTQGVIKPGDIQRMSAGSGIEHSEYNASNDNPVHFLQIWILPEEKNITPSYEQKNVTDKIKRNQFVLVGDRHGTDGAVTIHQDVKMFVAHIDAGAEIKHSFEKGRGGYMHLARGQITLNGETLKEGDSAEITEKDFVTIKGAANSEIILFDMI